MRITFWYSLNMHCCNETLRNISTLTQENTSQWLKIVTMNEIILLKLIKTLEINRITRYFRIYLVFTRLRDKVAP